MTFKTVTTGAIATAGVLSILGAGLANATPNPTPAPIVTNLKPAASLKENERALDSFTTIMDVAAGVGGVGGTIAGAVVGCVITIETGCIPGALIGAPIGALIGTVAIGGPALVLAGGDTIATYMAAPGTTRWAHEDDPIPGTEKSDN
jgi:hypothetical protein